MSRLKRFSPIGSLVGLVLMLISRATSAQEMNLRAVYNSPGGIMAPVWVAQEAGYFSKHGVSVDMKYLPSTSAVQAIVSGGEEVGEVAAQGIDAKLEGADLVYVASGVSTFAFQMYARPEIKTLADLKGKVVAVTQPASAGDYASRIVLRKNGLVPDNDVKITYAQETNNVLNLLSSGNVAAGILSAPLSIKAMAAGNKMLVNITDLKIPFLFMGILSSPKVVREKNEALTRFLRSYIEAMAVIRKDKETTFKTLSKFLKTNDREVLESVYQEYRHVYPVTPLMTAAEVRAVLDVAKSPKAKTMKPEEFFDNSIVQKIQASGFIEQVNK
jgi:NitT/TauT family transport system substrate-binding protein